MNLFNSYIDKVLRDYNIKNYEVSLNYFMLQDWHEASSGLPAINLNKDILIINKIVVEGITTDVDILANDFVSLNNDKIQIDLKPFTKTSIYGTIGRIEAELFKVIEGSLSIYWDNTNFVIPIAANIKTAYIEYYKIFNRQ